MGGIVGGTTTATAPSFSLIFLPDARPVAHGSSFRGGEALRRQR